MREKMLKIADRLMERAAKYEEPFGDDRTGLVKSTSFTISTTLREVALQIRAELKPNDG